MYKKIGFILLLGFLAIGAVSALNDFAINDGFNATNEYCAVNDDGMYLYTWEYDDDLIRESYLQNDTDYHITSGDNNTYNVTYNSHGSMGAAMSYVKTGNVTLDHGVLEIVEVNGDKYIIMTYMDEGPDSDLKLCFDELMKFNENNNIEPLADAI